MKKLNLNLICVKIYPQFLIIGNKQNKKLDIGKNKQNSSRGYNHEKNW